MSLLKAEIPVGYKETEVGVIPEDWDSLPLESYTSFISYGFTNPMPTVNDGPSMITARDINYGKIQFHTARSTSQEAFDKFLSPKSKPRINDILLTKDGTLGRLALVDKDNICINQSVAILRPTNKINPVFFKLLLESPKYQEKMLDNAGGSTIKHIYITIVNKMVLGLPKCLDEQTAIANALSDVDALLSELEKLIAKKQAIKTATMQQLLTGKTRLPQFATYTEGEKQGQPKGKKSSELGEIPEDWEVLSIGNLAHLDPENLGTNTPANYEFEYISLEQVSHGVLTGTTRYIYQTSPSRARRVLKKGDVLVSTVRPNLKSHYHIQTNVKDLVCSTGFAVIRSKQSKLIPEIIFQHFFCYIINNQIEMIVSGSNYPAINSSEVKNLKIQVGSIEEQTIIATILSDMDEEIKALQQRLSKTRQIKQGMMQELLTGKTRLPFDKAKEQGEAHAD